MELSLHWIIGDRYVTSSLRFSIAAAFPCRKGAACVSVCVLSMAPRARLVGHTSRRKRIIQLASGSEGRGMYPRARGRSNNNARSRDLSDLDRNPSL